MPHGRLESVELPGGWLSARGVVGGERVLAVFRPALIWAVLRTPVRLLMLGFVVVASLVWWVSGGGGMSAGGMVGGGWAVGVAVLLLALQVGWNALQIEARWYVVTERRVLAVGGVLGRFSTEVPLEAVRAVVIARPWLERAFGVGSVGFGSAATGGLEVLWVGVRDAEGVAEHARRVLRGPDRAGPGAGGGAQDGGDGDAGPQVTTVDRPIRAARPSKPAPGAGTPGQGAASKSGAKSPRGPSAGAPAPETPAPGKTTAGKPTAKKTPTKKPTPKKTTDKKTASKKATTKKTATKKTASKKTASKKSSTRKTSTGKASKKRGTTGDGGTGKAKGNGDG